MKKKFVLLVQKHFLKKYREGKENLAALYMLRGLFHSLFVSFCTCMVQKGHPLSSPIFPMQKISFLKCKSVYSYSEQTMFPEDFFGQ